MARTNCVFLAYDELRIEPTSYDVAIFYGSWISSVSNLDLVKKLTGNNERRGYKFTSMRNYTHSLMVF